jgi:hypothetical protein
MTPQMWGFFIFNGSYYITVKNILLSVLFLFGGLLSAQNLQYTIVSQVEEHTTIPTSGSISLKLRKHGGIYLGTVKFVSDSLTTVEKVVVTNFDKGVNYFDMVLLKSGYTVVMYEYLFGLFNEGKVIVFYETNPVKK